MVFKEGWNSLRIELENTRYRIICYGAGAVPTLAEPLLVDIGIWDEIDYFLDNSPEKKGTFIGDTRKIEIIPLADFLESGKGTKFIMLIMCEAYVPILEMLNKVESLKNVSCYAYIKLNYELIKNADNKIRLMSRNIKDIIPKKIHYCWFSDSPMSELNKKCIESWKKYCSDYEIIEWNEKNYDVDKVRYTSEAYRRGKWAYVSDYARLDILYNEGGIYLDTDVELKASLDELLKEKAFMSLGQWSAVNSGAGIGCVSEYKLIGEMRDTRADIGFEYENGTLNLKQNGYYESAVLRKYGFRQDFSTQYVDDLLILPIEYMATASLLGRDVFVTDRTVSIHHCEGNWASRKTLDERRQTEKSV